MLDAIDQIARIIGYCAIIYGIGRVLITWLDQKQVGLPIPSSEEIAKAIPRLWLLKRRLDEEYKSDRAIHMCSTDRSFDITFEKRGDRIHFFAENAYTRTSGEGTGEFVHFVLQIFDLESIGRWAKEL